MDAFERKVQSAAVAGWWTLLIAAGFLTIQWIAYLIVMSTRPAWILFLLGTGLTWNSVQIVWFWAAMVFKLCLWLAAVIVLWLTLWARQMRRRNQL